jgi:acetyl-CoA synthetase
MVYSAYTFKNVFNYEDNDIFGVPLILVGLPDIPIFFTDRYWTATTVIFEGVPSYPDFSRFWQTIEKHKVTQFYTAPTAIRALAKEHRIRTTLPIDFESDWIRGRTHQWGSLALVQQPRRRQEMSCVDTWWQTETGGIMISPIAFVTPTNLRMLLYHYQEFNPFWWMKTQRNWRQSGYRSLCIKFPWPELPEPFGAIISVIKTRIFLPSR